jgi:hypothetical protein
MGNGVMQIVRKQATEIILKRQPQARDSFVLCSASELSGLIQKHCGSYAQKAQDALAGKNETLTALADKYLSQFEHDVFSGQGWQTRDSVVGSFPNVPALIAGVPCSMRQRQRATRNIAPLTLYLELTGSASVHGTQFIERGAAVLALAQLLANTRPVEVWTCTTYGDTGVMQMVACQIDTTPLNVSVAAAMLCDEHVRQCGHQVNVGELGHYEGSNGPRGCSGWAYGVPELERKHAGEILAGILNPGSTMVYIPATYSTDQLANPAQWVRDMLAKYGAGAED